MIEKELVIPIIHNNIKAETQFEWHFFPNIIKKNQTDLAVKVVCEIFYLYIYRFVFNRCKNILDKLLTSLHTIADDFK